MGTKPRNVFEKILNGFAWVAFFVAIIVSAVTVFSTFSDEKNGKEIFGVKFLIVASDSMSKSEISQDEPIFFNAGDIVIIKTGADTTKLQEGQVISFYSYNQDSFGETLTHKITGVQYTPNGRLIGYTTCGINKGETDQAIVSPDSIIGVYTGKVQYLGYVFSFLKTPRGFAMSVITPTILLIIYFSVAVGRILGRREQHAFATKMLAVSDPADTTPTPQVADEDVTSAPDTTAELTAAEQQIKALQEQIAQLQEQNAEMSKQPAVASNVAAPTKPAGKRLNAQQLFDAITNQFATYDKVKVKSNDKANSFYYKHKLVAQCTQTEQGLKLRFEAGAVKLGAISTEADAINFVDNLMAQKGATK